MLARSPSLRHFLLLPPLRRCSYSPPRRSSSHRTTPQLLRRGAALSPPLCFLHRPLALMPRGGDWDGSNVHDDHIDFLHKTRQLPGRDYVWVRLAPEKEISPAPEEDERVIFRSHCLRGLGLPASGFFRSFVEFY